MKKIATIIIAISIMFSFISCQAYRDKKEKERIELKHSVDSIRRLMDTLKSLRTHCYVMTEPYLSPEKIERVYRICPVSTYKPDLGPVVTTLG